MRHFSSALGFVGVVVIWSSATLADVNVAYHDPSGGWAYSYVGEDAWYHGIWYSNKLNDDRFGQLDGVWDPTWHLGVFGGYKGGWDIFNGTEQWDHYDADVFGLGTYDRYDQNDVGRIGTSGTPNVTPAPGGIWPADDSNGDGAKYLRIQCAGNTGDDTGGWGWVHTNVSSTNKKLNFVHDITGATAMGEPGTANLQIVDQGVTLSFRARLATAAADPECPLDDEYRTGPSGPYTWPTGGDGNTIEAWGNGMFGVAQAEPVPGDYLVDPAGKQIGFSLATHADLVEAGAGHLSSGLVMNNNCSDSVVASGAADTNSTSQNIVEIAEESLGDWHEFWITIQANDSTPGNGTHTVNVYLDGCETPETFDVTACNLLPESMSKHYWGYSFLQMGHCSTLRSSAVDVDFFSYKAGVWLPTSARQPGDANGDGYVDDLDASILGAHWLSSGAYWGDGDFNCDHVVDDKDAAILAAHWNPPLVGDAVPEPSILVLLVIGGGVLLAWRKRKAVCE